MDLVPLQHYMKFKAGLVFSKVSLIQQFFVQYVFCIFRLDKINRIGRWVEEPALLGTIGDMSVDLSCYCAPQNLHYELRRITHICESDIHTSMREREHTLHRRDFALEACTVCVSRPLSSELRARYFLLRSSRCALYLKYWRTLSLHAHSRGDILAWRDATVDWRVLNWT